MDSLFEQCKADVAIKYKLGKTLVIGHLPKYYEEAAVLYHARKCKADGLRSSDEKDFHIKKLEELVFAKDGVILELRSQLSKLKK